MSTLEALPTRKNEAWRYADLDAVAALWPLPEAEKVSVTADEAFSRTILCDSPNSITRLNIVLEKGAQGQLHILNCGGQYNRVEVSVTLHEGADFQLGAVQLGGGSQNLEVISEVLHVEPNATSNQVVRSVLAGTATGTVLGKVHVAEGAIGTDASQSVRAMLLDRTAQANARPELEIYADDVKCAHGCAIGELDAMGLFYLESRGIDPAAAKRLMLQAFIAEAFIGAQDEELLQSRALERLENLV